MQGYRRDDPGPVALSPAPQHGVRVRTPLLYPDGGVIDVFVANSEGRCTAPCASRGRPARGPTTYVRTTRTRTQGGMPVRTPGTKTSPNEPNGQAPDLLHSSALRLLRHVRPSGVDRGRGGSGSRRTDVPGPRTAPARFREPDMEFTVAPVPLRLAWHEPSRFTRRRPACSSGPWPSSRREAAALPPPTVPRHLLPRTILEFGWSRKSKSAEWRWRNGGKYFSVTELAKTPDGLGALRMTPSRTCDRAPLRKAARTTAPGGGTILVRRAG